MKKEKILMICVPILCLIAIVLAYFKVINVNNDALKFKKEYESYNGKKASNGKEYPKVSISINNPIKYASYDELLDIINNGTGVIYLGFTTCPWCRVALPVFLDAAKDNKIETIYYMDILKERDSYTVEDDKLVYLKDEDGNELKGTKGYFKLLAALDENLSDYVIISDGKSYEVGEKRIYSPSAIFVRDGKVLGIHVSTVESQKSPFDKLTKEQYEELYDIYDGYMKQLQSTTCTVGEESNC